MAIYFLRETENIATHIWLINVYENLKSLPYIWLFTCLREPENFAIHMAI